MTSQNVDLESLESNQEVYSSDGQKLGDVAGITVDRETGEKVLGVTSGLVKTLYVPESAIEYAVLSQPVRLKVPADEARERFSQRPNVL